MARSKGGGRGPNGLGSLRSDGYRQLKRPDHPLACATGIVFEHRMVLYDSIGPGPHPCHWCKQLLDWDDLQADHLNHIRADNRPKNLVPSCPSCNKGRWNLQKSGCPHGHGPYDKAYANGHRYCSKCKAEKERRRRLRKKIEVNR